MAQIIVESLTEADLEKFLDLSLLEYGVSASTNPEHIRWKHLDSPFGASTYVSLVDAGQVVGRALIQPRTLCSATKEFKAASVMDLLIDSAHRATPANFINITKTCGGVAGNDLIFHTSNARTFPLYSKLLKFANPFSLKAYGFPVRLAGVAASIFGRRFALIDWLATPVHWILKLSAYVVNSVARLDVSHREMRDAELDALCEKCLRQSGPHLARTNAFLKWRFGDAPLWPADVWRIDRKGKLFGYVVTRKVELGGLTHLVLMDFLLDPDTPMIARISLRMWLIREAISSQADALFTMANSYSQIASKFLGFPLMGIPDNLLPHATPIFMRVRTKDNRELETDRSMHMTLGDLDYF